jgi:hypothetical protein
MTKEQILMRDVLIKEHKFFVGHPDRIQDAINHPDEFNVTRMIEKALAYRSRGRYTFVDADGYDFSDYSDAKTASVRMNNQNTGQCCLSIRNIANKVGAIRLIVFNPFTDSTDFFYIPSHAKRCVGSFYQKGSYSSIEVPWSRKNGYNKLNQFQVATFKDLATKQ